MLYKYKFIIIIIKYCNIPNKCNIFNLPVNHNTKSKIKYLNKYFPKYTYSVISF